jgi:predicted RNA-binding protein YlqC (UPF0109 family)
MNSNNNTRSNGDTVTNTANATSTTTTAQDALRKAQEIAARLSNQIVVANGTTTSSSYQQQGQTESTSLNGINATSSVDATDTNTTMSTSTTGSKRKRWGMMSNDATGTGTGTGTTEPANSSIKRMNSTTATSDGTVVPASTATYPVMANTQIPIAQLLLGTNPNATTSTPPTITTAVKRLWVTVNHERPAAHFVAYCTPKIRQIVAKANGILLPPDDENDTNTKDATQEDTKDATKEDEVDDDENDETKLRIVFKGKGSTNIPPLPGVPEEPLHIYMTGPKALVDASTKVIDDLINEASKAEPLIEAVIAAQQAQEQALIVTMESIYKPMSVTALIHGNSNNNSMINPTDSKDKNALLALPADRLAAALLHGTTAALTEEMLVPNNVVGTIIGRGGETIASIQAQTNCKLQIQKEQDIVPGQTDRIITLSSNNQSSIDQCRMIIQSLINERLQKLNQSNSNGGNQQQQQYGNNNNYNNNNSNNIVLLDGSTVPSHYSLVEVMVPDADVGLVIGKMGGMFYFC